MKIDAGIETNALTAIPDVAREAEALGFDGLWTSEAAHNPYLPLAVAAVHSRRLELGTAIAVAFPRSPMVTAQVAWDLQAASGGRFILGLGTQVKGHNERRFSVPWESPGPKLREMILSIRAIWDTFQNGTPLDYQGRFYRFSLMTPFFSGGPIEHPRIPIYIAGVNEYMCRLAGELCDGFHVHPFHTTRYVREFVRPLVAEGAAKTGRDPSRVALSSSVFVIAGDTEAEREPMRALVRSQLSFYASTRTYAKILETHGWQEIGDRLSELSRTGGWGDMPGLISDEMLEHCAVTGTWDEIPELIRERYAGVLDRVSLYWPFVPGRDPNERWRRLVDVIHR
ncbi:MAG: TIGR03617 family F420-dependent LLM class oxidoreductase [Deltaproteobacteria bacterium]|nr:TIGR03617 family F420-dependent LLM class oxidoreductase [Deltaproteobacteria bacterium]